MWYVNCASVTLGSRFLSRYSEEAAAFLQLRDDGGGWGVEGQTGRKAPGSGLRDRRAPGTLAVEGSRGPRAHRWQRAEPGQALPSP